MIEVIYNDDRRLILKDRPPKHWIAFILGLAIAIIINCQLFSVFTIYSSLTCNKNWLKQTNCELIEYSVFKSNIKHQEIDNIGIPKGIQKGGTIWLGTEVDLLHNRIKNVYYPSYTFLGLFDIYLYRFRGQALQELNKITEYVRDRHTKKDLILTRTTPIFFYISFLLLLLLVTYPIFIISFQPDRIYNFDFQEKHLAVKYLQLKFACEDETHPFESLSIESPTISNKNQDISISLYAGKYKILTCDRFHNKQEILKAIDKLKQHIYTQSK